MGLLCEAHGIELSADYLPAEERTSHKGSLTGRISLDALSVRGYNPFNSRPGKNKVQNLEAANKPWYRPCSRCGKDCFSDFLDSEGLCDYCRETKAMKATATLTGKKRKYTK